MKPLTFNDTILIWHINISFVTCCGLIRRGQFYFISWCCWVLASKRKKPMNPCFATSNKVVISRLSAVHGVTKSRTRLSGFTFTFHFHALEKEMATHSSVLAWRIPGVEEPGGLPSMESHRVEHDWSDLAAAAAAAAGLLDSVSERGTT